MACICSRPLQKTGEVVLLAQETTELGVETGGILAGVHIEDYFEVTHLIIPEQTAAKDKWEVQDVRQITNFFTYHPDLIMLGLIHTHPNFDSFLSSVDLHALWDYAQHNHSLVSIVLAPERRTWPAYCLTKIGFKELSKCKVPGFHKHKKCDSRLNKEADYVLYDQSTNIIFEDFRL